VTYRSGGTGCLVLRLLTTVTTSVLPVATARLADEAAHRRPGEHERAAFSDVARHRSDPHRGGRRRPAQLDQYLWSELDREMALRAQATLFTTVDRFVGLSGFEEPRFLDRLRPGPAEDPDTGVVLSGGQWQRIAPLGPSCGTGAT
jgi:ATP-binding cassette subfamily B protein